MTTLSEHIPTKKLDNFLFDPIIISLLKKEKLKFLCPTYYSKFVTYDMKFRFMYGSMFEPHSDPPEQEEIFQTFQFCLWRKDFVFTHIVNNKIVIVEPTLEPIKFDFRRLHSYIPRKHLSRIKVVPSEKDFAWWCKIRELYVGNLLLIGKFL